MDNIILVVIKMYPLERQLDYKVCTEYYYKDNRCEHTCEAMYFASQEDLQKYLNYREKQKYAIITKNNGEYLLAQSFVD